MHAFQPVALAIGGYLPIDTVYAYEPVPVGLEPPFAKHILGAQAQIWTEYIEGPKNVEYMAYPRACALAEVLWTPKDRRDFPDFTRRLAVHEQRLDALDVNYRRGEPAAPPAAAPQPSHSLDLPWPTGTFSILAYDPQTGEIGAAVQSRVFSVGNGVLWAEAGVGAAATQAIVDVMGMKLTTWMAVRPEYTGFPYPAIYTNYSMGNTIFTASSPSSAESRSSACTAIFVGSGSSHRMPK